MTWLAHYLDLRTLLALNAFLSIVSAAGLFGLWFNRRTEKGLGFLALSSVSYAVGFALFLVPGAPVFVDTILANGIIDLGTFFAFLAIWRFFNRQKDELLFALPSILLFGTEAAIWAGQGPDMRFMVPLGCAARAWLTILCGYYLLMAAKGPLRFAGRLSAVFHFAWAAMLAGRICWALFTTDLQIAWDPTGPAALLARIALTFIIIPSYLWMVTRRQDEELITQARQDALTGVANRRVIWEEGPKAVTSSIRRAQPLAVLMFDIDHFKSVNDTWGHDGGDKVLVHVAQTVAAMIRSSDIVARVGGEEFMVLMPNTSPAEAVKISERLRLGIEKTGVELGTGQLVRCTFSGGIGQLGGRKVSWEDVVKDADDALYQAKRSGRNRVASSPALAAA